MNDDDDLRAERDRLRAEVMRLTEAVRFEDTWHRAYQNSQHTIEAVQALADRRLHQNEALRRENLTLQTELAETLRRAEALVREHLADCERTRILLQGSPEAPTDDELAAHPGRWRATSTGDLIADMLSARMAAAVRDLDREQGRTRRWWCLTDDGVICERPRLTTT